MKTYELTKISKEIKGTQIFENITCKLEAGKVYGLIGANGSGKTMLMRIMSGLIKPSGGEILIDGKKADLMRKRDFSIGILIENIGLYPEMTGYDNLKYLASINKFIGKKEIIEILEKVGLEPNGPKKVRKYSLGMKQKLSLAQCFMENPDLILLDEPTNALDEKSVVKVLNLIKEHSERGAIIVIASHIKNDVFSVCDKIFEIKEMMLCEVEK